MAYETRFGRLVPIRKNWAGARIKNPVSTKIVFPADKGKFGGHCNMSSCLAPGADWYNHGSNAYYCEDCAHMLNNDQFNKRDAMAMFGHDLCTKEEKKE